MNAILHVNPHYIWHLCWLFDFYTSDRCNSYVKELHHCQNSLSMCVPVCNSERSSVKFQGIKDSSEVISVHTDAFQIIFDIRTIINTRQKYTVYGVWQK